MVPNHSGERTRALRFIEIAMQHYLTTGKCDRVGLCDDQSGSSAATKTATISQGRSGGAFLMGKSPQSDLIFIHI